MSQAGSPISSPCERIIGHYVRNAVSGNMTVLPKSPDMAFWYSDLGDPVVRRRIQATLTTLLAPWLKIQIGKAGAAFVSYSAHNRSPSHSPAGPGERRIESRTRHRLRRPAEATIRQHCKALRLPTIASQFQRLADQAIGAMPGRCKANRRSAAGMRALQPRPMMQANLGSTKP